ncbi:MAG: hypothetical protein LPK88_06625 [Alphaproteobacteria bacterium]|nr:hypothetical protein [Alphaproteobacteria bacterium]MDX5415980.1 hypothetical protein [Alphaproteobacteria bacterium]MDX5493277.1 hypothetical protein [Alphaproteobacteria bacterium]
MTALSLSAPRPGPLKTAALVLWAALWLGNALWMLADPASWYRGIDGVSNTGPFNVHFVRDIGVAYLTIGLMTAAAIRWPAAALPLLGGVTLYLALHGLLHVWDIAAARLPAEHILMDVPGVFLPPFISAALAWWCAPAHR